MRRLQEATRNSRIARPILGGGSLRLLLPLRGLNKVSPGATLGRSPHMARASAHVAASQSIPAFCSRATVVSHVARPVPGSADLPCSDALWSPVCGICLFYFSSTPHVRNACGALSGSAFLVSSRLFDLVRLRTSRSRPPVLCRHKPRRGSIMPILHSSAAPSAAASPPGATPQLPGTGFLRQPQVLAFVPISKSTLWRRIQAHTFPEPVKLSQRVTVWRAEDIRRWIDAQGKRE